MDPPHRLGLATLLDCLGDLTESIRWSELNNLMVISTSLSEIKTLLHNSCHYTVGEHIWDNARALVQASHHSCLILAQEDPRWRHRHGFRYIAKLIVETEGQLNTCVDVLKVIAIGTKGYTHFAEQKAFDLEYALSDQDTPPPINRVSRDPVIQAHLAVRQNRQCASGLLQSILRSLPDAFEVADRLNDLTGSDERSVDREFTEQDRRLAERWFPNEGQEGAGYYERFGALERRIVEVTNRLERMAGSYGFRNYCVDNTNQGEPIPDEDSDHSKDAAIPLFDG